MAAAQKEIANIDKQIRAEALKVVASLDEQARIAESREKSLVASLEELKSQEGNANLDDVKLKALEREASADRALLEALLIRYAEASARQDRSSQPGFGVVIQNASVPVSPSFPKPGPMVLLITVAGFSVGLGLAFLIELMAAASRLTEGNYTSGARTEPVFERVATETAALPLASPPPPAHQPPATEPHQPQHCPPQPTRAPPTEHGELQHLTVWPRIIPQGDMSGVTDSLEVAAAAHRMARWTEDIGRTLDVKTIGLTSLGGGTADSCVAALALARTVAITGKRVVLVDLARTGSFLGGLCGVQAGPGISDLVNGTADFTKVIGRDTRSPVHVLRYGTDHTPRTTALMLERIESVISALSGTYDFTIVNLGEAVDDTPIFLHKCKAALLLASPARLGEVTAAVQTLLDTGLSAAQHILIGQPSPASAAAMFEAVSA
jgi:polysaccharide biosynthesis transport protein